MVEAVRQAPGGRGVASKWVWGALLPAVAGGGPVGVGWAPGAAGTVGWPLTAVPEAPGPETAAWAKVTQRPALTHARDRPRGPGGERALGPSRAASVSPAPGRAGAWPAGRARGRPGPGYLWKETARFSPLPCRLEQFAAAQQITISRLGRRAAPPPGSGPRLVAPSPERDRPEGRRAETRLRDVGAGPRGAVRQDGVARLPAAGRRPSALPRSQAPGGALPGARGVGGGRGRPGQPIRSATWRTAPVRTARWPRLRVRAQGGLTCSPQGHVARLLLLSPSRRVAAGVLEASAEGRRGAERAGWAVRVGPRRTSRWRPALFRAHFRPRPRPGLAPAAARRVALPTRRSDAALSRRPEEGRWTQVRACPGAGTRR